MLVKGVQRHSMYGIYAYLGVVWEVNVRIHTAVPLVVSGVETFIPRVLNWVPNRVGAEKGAEGVEPCGARGLSRCVGVSFHNWAGLFVAQCLNIRIDCKPFDARTPPFLLRFFILPSFVTLQAPSWSKPFFGLAPCYVAPCWAPAYRVSLQPHPPLRCSRPSLRSCLAPPSFLSRLAEVPGDLLRPGSAQARAVRRATWRR